METIQIEKIKIGENVRKDYGDLTELIASIKEHGVRKPIELTTSNLLVDGYRRLKAAKAAGLNEVPFFYWDGKTDVKTCQMLAGIFQKNLNPVEEGKAYRNYMDKGKIGVETLAKRISKQVVYVNKRLLLVNLSKEIQEALIKKKILIGHALLLAKLTKQDSLKFLKEITRNNHSVEQAKGEIQYHGFSLKLSEAMFNKSACKDCKFNGSKQAELFETGTVLNGTCMNPGCYHKKVKEFVKQKRIEFKDVLYKPESEYATPKGYEDGSHEWVCKDKGITEKYKENCRKEKSQLVIIRDNGEMIEYFKIPPKSTKVGDKSVEQGSLDETRELKLTGRVNEFKTTFLINKSIELMQPGTKQTKALSLLRLIQNAGWEEFEDKELPKFVRDGRGNLSRIKNIFDAKESELDNAIRILSKKALRRVDLKELITISRNFNVDIKKHFKITKEYLEIYTKDQLIELIEEFKIYVDAEDPKVKTISSGNIKKGELIQHILNQNLKGKVPKILL